MSQQAAESGAQSLASVVGCVYMFFLSSHASEFIDVYGRLHLVLLVGVFCMFALIAVGSLPIVLTTKQGIWLTLFTSWITISLPFSVWRGGTFSNFMNVWLKSYIAFLLVAGLTFTWQQMRRGLFWLALAPLTVMLIAYRSGKTSQDRFEVAYGSLGNANDLAGNLLMGLPFLLYVAGDPRRNPLIRVFFGFCGLVLLGFVFKTGSRAGLLAAGVLALLGFLKAPAKGKAAILVLALCGAAAFPVVVSRATMYRYLTMFKSNITTNLDENQVSAVLSTNARRSEMGNAVTLTLRHPLFGVGLGNFTHQSANLYLERGEAPLWFTVHDIYLMVMSETGIPGTICYFAVLIICLRSLLKLMKECKKEPSLADISRMTFCLFLSYCAFLITGIFSTSAYTFQLPLLAGLTAALERIARPMIIEAQEARLQEYQQALPYIAPRPFARNRRPALPAPR